MLRRCITTFNCIAGRPHCPREKNIKEMFTQLGLPLPGKGQGSDDEECSEASAIESEEDHECDEGDENEENAEEEERTDDEECAQCWGLIPFIMCGIIIVSHCARPLSRSLSFSLSLSLSLSFALPLMFYILTIVSDFSGFLRSR